MINPGSVGIQFVENRFRHATVTAMAGSAKAPGTTEYPMSGKSTLATVTWRIIMLTAIDVSILGHFCESVRQSGERLQLRGCTYKY